MSKDTYSARDKVSLASILNAQMYLRYLLCRVILLFFDHSCQNCCPIVVAPKIDAEHRRPSSPKITHHPSIFHHPHRYLHHLNIPTTVLLLHLSNSQRQSSIAAENVCPTSRQRSTIWFPVLVECWASAKPNVCARNCKVM